MTMAKAKAKSIAQTEPKETTEGFLVRIVRIKDFGFLVYEFLHTNDPSKIITIRFQNRIGFTVDQNMVELSIRVFFFYDDNPENVLGEIQVQNVFEVPDLRKYLRPNNILILPPSIITAIVGVSISHTRSLFCKNLAGTLFQNVIIPIVDAQQISKEFFPYMFGANTDQVVTTEFPGPMPGVK
jgi:hypothetical protein